MWAVALRIAQSPEEPLLRDLWLLWYQVVPILTIALAVLFYGHRWLEAVLFWWKHWRHMRRSVVHE